ncbi:rhomboid family intramembrane serine protease [Lysobacter korlensis]|uniref:Rhomboid family intramembrane serine protease n=1 Tax=Lysobacter korlensis TaxID=553636 RepID=A0ABV6RU78_9GAMM
MSDPASTPGASVCYRHPDRETWVLCQRCGRPICGECQTTAPVGVHCPECVREARQSAPRTKSRLLTTLRAPGDRPIVTYALVLASVAVFAVMFLTGGANGLVGRYLIYFPPLTLVEPWRVFTSMFAHANFFHILFNMYALYLFGTQLEYLLGRGRFLALYFLSGIGGAAAVMVLSPATPVLGASGAIFGLFSAYFVISRRLGSNATQLLIVIGLNFALGFLLPGISWQAHLGGAVAGALVALVLVSTRRPSQQPAQLIGLIGVGIVLVAVLLSRYFVSY